MPQARLLEILDALPRLPPVAEQMQLIMGATLLFQAEPNVVPLAPPLAIIADIHGQFEDLKYCAVHALAQPRLIQLGDFVDRGPNSLECLLFLAALKLLNPAKVTVLRGNHEVDEQARVYGYYDEVQRKSETKVYAASIRLFEALPVAAVCRLGGQREPADWVVPEAFRDAACLRAGGKVPPAEFGERMRGLLGLPPAGGEYASLQERILSMSRAAPEPREPAQRRQGSEARADSVFFVHGGITPRYRTVLQISQASRFGTQLNELLWPDPDSRFDFFGVSSRGNGQNFGYLAAKQFLVQNDLQLIVRAHQYQEDGFSLFEGVVATVWSAANYCGRCNNRGSYAVYDAEGYLWAFRFESQRRFGASQPQYPQIDYFL